MNMFEEVNNTPVAQIAVAIGLKNPKGNMYSPCPCCNSETRSDTDKRPPIGMSGNGKGFQCHRCQAKGSLFDLVCYSQMQCRWQDASKNEKNNLRLFLEENNFIPKTHKNYNNLSSRPKVRTASEIISPPSVQKKVSNQPSGGFFGWDKSKPKQYKDNLYTEQGSGVLKYLTEERKICIDVLKKADIGCVWRNTHNGLEYWLTIPLKDPDGTIVNIRYRSVPPAKKTYRVCTGRPMPLYGADTLSQDRAKFVIITEGELDVLALQTYGYNDVVVSGTTGASSNWPDEWLDVLEKYRGFFVWYDDDEAGRVGAGKVAEALGKYRCFKVNYKEHNDVGDALREGVDEEAIQDAFSGTSKFIEAELKTVDEYYDQLEELIKNPKNLQGLSTQSIKMDRCIGGIRSGLWVVTGDTGHGKTSFLTWLLYAQAKAGVPVMVTSFEQRPIGTMQKLIRMELGRDFTTCTPEERKWAAHKLGKLPLQILDHYGELNSDDVVATIRCSVRRHKTKIALVDHLGFLAGADGGADERHVLEGIVRKLATVAVQDDICIMLVCHPNNTSVYQQRRVKISDLKGASAIRQDAHVALVIERAEFNEKVGFPVTTVYIDKVRSEFGNNGSSCRMAFDPISCCYGDTWEDTPTGKKGRKFTKGG